MSPSLVQYTIFTHGYRALNLPTSDFSYDDIGLLTAAMTESDSVPIQAGMVEFVKLKDKLKLILIDSSHSSYRLTIIAIAQNGAR